MSIKKMKLRKGNQVVLCVKSYVFAVNEEIGRKVWAMYFPEPVTEKTLYLRATDGFFLCWV